MRVRSGAQTFVWFVLIGLFHSACAVGPDYVRPDLSLPERWRTETSELKDLISTSWWQGLDDAELTKLVEHALAGNNDLKIAAARVERFYALYGASRADFFPQLDAAASYRRYRNSALGIFPGQGTIENDYQIFGGLNWELDVWGRIRRSTESARADILSQEAARRAVIVSVVAGVVQTYSELRELDKRLAITRGTLESRRQSLKLARDRFDAGTSSELDVRQAESDLFAVQALVPSLEAQVAQAENRLNVLLGSNPGAVVRGKSIDELIVGLGVPSLLPARLIDERPDIVQAEEALRAANARIGVAKAAYFPTLSLTGVFGFVSNELSEWLRSPSRQWEFGPDIAAPIFQGGRIRSQVRAARAQTEEAVANYRQTVVTALQEVEDALIGFQKSLEQISAQSQQVASLQKYVQLSQQRYDEGQSSYLEVLDAQRNLLQAELSLSQNQGLKLNRYVALFRALGGAWVDRAAEAAPAPDSKAGDLF